MKITITNNKQNRESMLYITNGYFWFLKRQTLSKWFMEEYAWFKNRYTPSTPLHTCILQQEDTDNCRGGTTVRRYGTPAEKHPPRTTHEEMSSLRVKRNMLLSAGTHN